MMQPYDRPPLYILAELPKMARRLCDAGETSAGELAEYTSGSWHMTTVNETCEHRVSLSRIVPPRKPAATRLLESIGLMKPEQITTRARVTEQPHGAGSYICNTLRLEFVGEDLRGAISGTVVDGVFQRTTIDTIADVHTLGDLVTVLASAVSNEIAWPDAA